jgi:hypothetical protein
MISRQRLGSKSLTPKQWTETDGILLDRAVQTCNSAHFSAGNAFASETSDMSTQAEADEVEILQFGFRLRHKELYQLRYVRSRCTCVLRSAHVVRSSGEHFPVDTNDVVIASSQISWKENRTRLQNLLLTLYYIIFHSGLTDWSLSYGF